MERKRMAPTETPTAIEPLDHLSGYTFTTREVATILKCSAKKLEADRLKGLGLPYTKLGGLVRYIGEDLAAALRQNRHEPEQV
jgi:hypothetical protein